MQTTPHNTPIQSDFILPMKLPTPPTYPAKTTAHGFALIATISVMVLLVMVALAMLSLSSIELRQAAHSKYREEAKANARMALMIAIGELQQTMGPDQRVSAEASILTDSDDSSGAQNHLLGVWRSWEGTDLTTENINYDSEKKDRFLQWLVSHPDPAALKDRQFASNPDGPDEIYLVNSGSVSDSNDYTKAWKVPFKSTANGTLGAYAWLVMGENTKAQVNLPGRNLTRGGGGSLPEYQSEISAPSTPDFRVLGNSLTDYPTGKEQAMRAITSKTQSLISESISSNDIKKHWFHFTTQSAAPIVDVNHGGVKQDLSLMMEGNLPTHLADTAASEQAWVTPRGVEWAYLQDFYNIYKKNTYPSGNSFATKHFIAPSGWGGGGGETTRQARISPIVARIQWLFSVSSLPEKKHAGKYDPALVMCPVVTLWNPYNTAIDDIRGFAFKVNVQGYPFEFKYQGALTKNWGRSLGSFTVGIADTGESSSREPFSLKPGESRVFSPSDLVEGGKILLHPGYRHYKGYKRRIRKNANLAGGSSFSAGIRMAENGNPVMSNNFFIRGGIKSVYRFSVKNSELKKRNITIEPSGGGAMTSIADKPKIFASVNLHLKTVRDNTFDVMGNINSNPLQIQVASTKVNDTENDPALNPAQNPYDLVIYEHSSWKDSLLPNIDQENHGFVASGGAADTGVPYAVISELPTRPMQSLVELPPPTPSTLSVMPSHLPCSHPMSSSIR